MVCYHGVLLQYVTMVYCYGVVPWCVAIVMVCYHGALPSVQNREKRNPCSLSAATLLCTFVQAVDLLFQVTLALTAQVGAAKDQQHSTCDATLIK